MVIASGKEKDGVLQVTAGMWYSLIASLITRSPHVAAASCQYEGLRLYWSEVTVRLVTSPVLGHVDL